MLQGLDIGALVILIINDISVTLAQALRNTSCRPSHYIRMEERHKYHQSKELEVSVETHSAKKSLCAYKPADNGLVAYISPRKVLASHVPVGGSPCANQQIVGNNDFLAFISRRHCPHSTSLMNLTPISWLRASFKSLCAAGISCLAFLPKPEEVPDNGTGSITDRNRIYLISSH